MGSVLGKVSVETPKYEVSAKGEDYEIREYPPQIAAEVTYDPQNMKRGKDGGFMVLASYIGAVGKPANIKATGDASETIAMTAPVITQESSQKDNPEKIAMTAPVITQTTNPVAEGETEQKKFVTMQFILPAQYTTVDGAPKPTDSRVSIKQIPQRKYGVLTFKGVADEKLTETKLATLKTALENAGYKINGDHLLARYNPPWTPAFLRTNEVMLPVE